VSDDEIGKVMAAIGTSEPQYAAELVNLQPAPSGDAPKAAAGRERDDMYEAAVEVVIREGRGSVSLLQRALGVGYGRGARLIDFMAEDGIVGQYAGSQAREVLITMEQWAERTGTPTPVADPAPRRLKIQPHAAVPPAATKRQAAASSVPPPATRPAAVAVEHDEDEDDLEDDLEDTGVDADAEDHAGDDEDGIDDGDEMVAAADDAGDDEEEWEEESDEADDGVDEQADDDGDGAEDDDWESADDDDSDDDDSDEDDSEEDDGEGEADEDRG
jgi:S-DNA-T family DNA segregation ATPase FtsK/SpoIIIE